MAGLAIDVPLEHVGITNALLVAWLRAVGRGARS
jgi:hypothetical protein